MENVNKLTQQQIVDLIQTLRKTFPDAKASLDFTTPFELLVAVVLSAQCTDKRVNIVTKELFKKYNTAKDINEISLETLEEYINTCGLYKQKAKSIKQTAKILVENYDGNVPNTMEQLLKLPGVGRKSANVILLDGFNISSGIAVDTHVKRISNLLGLSDKTNPEDIEKDLTQIIPQKYFKDINHLFIYHGRAICKAKKPDCNNCPISNYCNHFKNLS